MTNACGATIFVVPSIMDRLAAGPDRLAALQRRLPSEVKVVTLRFRDPATDKDVLRPAYEVVVEHPSEMQWPLEAQMYAACKRALGKAGERCPETDAVIAEGVEVYPDLRGKPDPFLAALDARLYPDFPRPSA